MAYSISFFYPGHTIQREPLEAALRGVLGELPHLAGRATLRGSGSRLADMALRCTNDGVTLATAAAPGVRWAAGWRAGQAGSRADVGS